MNIRGGWALIRHTWLSWVQHRSFFFLLAFMWMIPSLIYLFVWMTVAGGGDVAGYTRGGFVAYYLVLILVNQLTYSQANWTVGDQIRAGTMSIYLMRPISPMFDALASEIAGKVVYMIFVLPVTFLLGLVLKPEITLTADGLGQFALSLGMAWVLRFVWGYWIALLSFWATRADALLAIQDSLIFLLAGQVAPIPLLPAVLQSAARILPFRYMIGFPVEVLTGQLNVYETIWGLVCQAVWLSIAVILFVIVWRAGLKQYAAVGG